MAQASPRVSRHKRGRCEGGAHNWTGLPTQMLCAGKDRTFSEDWHPSTPTGSCYRSLYRSWYSGRKRPHVCSCVLEGEQPQEKGCSTPGQTVEEGRLFRWRGAGQL